MRATAFRSKDETMIKTITVAAMIFGAAISFASAKDAAVTRQDQQQAACYDDAQRLCGDAMPDVDKVIACMKPRKAQVSAKCAAFYDAEN